jgi:hypothetical protein
MAGLAGYKSFLALAFSASFLRLKTALEALVLACTNPSPIFE